MRIRLPILDEYLMLGSCETMHLDCNKACGGGTRHDLDLYLTGKHRRRLARSASHRLQRGLPAKVAGVREAGLDVEMLRPLPLGARFWVGGELHSSRFCMGVEGWVRVADCLRAEGGIFRISLAWEDCTLRSLQCGLHNPRYRWSEN